MWPDEPFYWFRTALFVGLAAYYVLTLAGTVWHVAVLLYGSDPHRRLLRLYLSYQLLSFRLRPLASELLQIVLWSAILVLIWWLHSRI
jgi:hypothetical protein